MAHFGALRAGAVASVLLVAAAPAGASSGGITGQSTAGCTSCHGTTFNYTASINGGSTTVGTGGFSNYTVQMTGSGAAGGGFNMSVINNGALSAGVDGGDAASVPQLIGGELTHSARRPGAAPSWTVRFTGGGSRGTATLRVCVNPVNGNNTNDAGDGSSNAGACTTRNVTVNDAPTATADSRTVGEDSGGTLFSLMSNDFSGSGSDDGNDSITITAITAAPANGSAVINGTNTGVTYTPDPDYNGSDSFTYRITDQGGLTDTATVSITVNSVADAPSTGGTINAIATYVENAAPVTLDSAVTITDVDSANLNLATVSITTNFTQAEDSLVCPNPTIAGISCSYANATGILSLFGSASLASYELALEDVAYQNSSNSPTAPLTRGISVTLRDTTNTSGTADTTSVNITAQNDTPVAVNDSATVDEDSVNNVLTVLGNDTDVDAGDTKTVTLVNGGAAPTCPTTVAVTHGTVCRSSAGANNTLTYTPTAGYVGPDSFTYTMADSGAATSSATVSITVANVGDAPVAVDDSFTISEDVVLATLDVAANDTDADAGDTKTVTLVNGGAVATCPTTTAITNAGICRSSTSAGNVLRLTPAANYAGPVTFAYTVQDGASLTDVGSVSVTVNNLADTPVAVADAQTISEDAAPVTLSVLANDTDADAGDTKRIISVGTPSQGGSVSIVGSGINNTLSYDSAPNFFGSETFSYTMEDAAGNTASATVTMTVSAINDAPLITSTAVTTAQDAVPYQYQVTVSDPDDLNNGAQLAWSLTTSPSGMTVSSTGLIQWTPPAFVAAGYNVTVRVADGGENSAAPATQSFTINVSVPDSDSDGMPDSFENQYGFDPNDGSDAAEDADGDGLTNLQEYQQGLDPTLDDVAPVVTAPGDLVVDATGYVTAVDLGDGTAVDGKDGTVTVASDWTLPVVRPGRYTVTWTATDAAGNTGTDTQLVDVRPLADFNVDQLTGEGTSVNVTVTLNGAPPAYPVTIPYTLAGTAGAGDSDAAAGTFTINSGLSATRAVSITNDGGGEAVETIVFSMTGATNAALGARRMHVISITDANVAPAATLAVEQGTPRFTLFRDQGSVTFTALASDPNPGNVLTYDWAGTATALLPPVASVSSWSVNASSVTAGSYLVAVTVRDQANAATTARVRIVVQDAEPALSSADTDNDGADDQAEGFADLDEDGIPDWRDAFGAQELLHDQSGSLANTRLLESDPGVALRVGATSLAAARTGALIASGDAALPVDSYDNLGGLFDFEIHGVGAGGIARVVLPLQTAIRPGAVYRKFSAAGGWHDFTSNASNGVASAYSSFGLCPGPASADYATGLAPFADCVRLTLQDGGPNDSDGVADGVIRDPGGVALVDAVPPVAATPAADGGAFGGLWLLLAAMLRFARRGLAFALAVVALPAAAQYGTQVPEAQQSRLRFTGDAGSGFDTNVGNAQADADVRESGFVNASGHASWQRLINLYTTLIVRGTLQGEHVNSFEGLSNAKGTGMARLIYRPDGDFFTPQIAGWVSASYWEFDSAIRDGVEYRGGVFLAQQLTTQVSGRLSLGASQRESESRVFDLAGLSAGLNVDWLPMQGLTIYGGYQHYRGDVVSTATPGTLNIGLAAEAIEADDAFGGFTTGMRAYRLDATSHIGSLGFNYALSRSLSVDAQAQQIETTADFDNEYSRTVGVVSLLARF